MKLKENKDTKKIKVKKGKVEKSSKDDVSKNSVPKSSAPSLKTISPAIFDYFNSLTNSNESDRLSSGLQLIQHISKSQQDDKRVTEINYTIKRLVRGVGASTTDSRAGFFTTLVGFLKSVSAEDVKIKELLDLTKKELHVGGVIVDKEDADAIVGQILVCGALLRSSKLVEASKEDISAVIQVLLAATKHRTYHTALAYSFVTELLNTISEEQFVESVWPHLEPEIIRPWPKQTINTVHCLFIVQKEFPSVVSSKYLKSKFTNSQILYPGNFKQILKIFWDSNNPNIILHEAFNALGPILANSKHLINFWTSEVEDYLKTPNKLKEIQTLKIISDIIDNLDPETVKISELLTNNFIKMMVASIQTIKTNKETLKAFYDDFFESLNNKFAKIIDEHEKVSILKKLIIHPGTICLEKYTSSRIVHQLIFQLKEEGIKELFEVYKAIFLNKTVKNLEDPAQNWLNFERLNAGFILQTLLLNKNAQNGNWRAEQLKVFMKFGLFYVSDKDEITKKENAGKVSEEFGEQMKNMFYACLQAKLPSLEEEKKMLVSLAQELNEFLAKKNVAKCFRGKFEENLLSIWSKVFKDVTSTKSKNQNLQLVFNILLLHMGLQLFRDAEMAESAILDLEKCMERTKAKKKSDDDEPEWIEVVTDLFLHLLSQNNGSLRHVVNSVFPHLCASLNLTAVHQILAVLDMKNHNPLENGSQQEGEESDEEEVEAEEEESDEDEDETDEEEDADDNDDDDEDNEDVEEEEEESTVTDKLRNAVSIALGSSMKVDDDQCSVDLNDMTEEEGKQLDEALSAAFKAIKKTSPSATKKSKSHRIQTTTVMHFRIRVLDLLEIYLQNKPTQLVTIEVMLDLFNMIEFCNENDLKPLQNKVEKLLQKLTAIKQFEKDEEGDINEENICDFIRLIVEKKVSASIFDFHNKLRTKCCLFLINCSKSLPDQKKVIALLSEFVDDYINSRNPKINIAVLNEIFKLKWQGVLTLIQRLISNGLKSTIRTFRRKQVLEILTVFFKNFEEKSASTLNAISKHLTTYLHEMSKKQSHEISTKEFNTLLDVIFVAHKKFNCLEKVVNHVQEIRKKIKLDSVNSYTRVCNLYKVSAIKNSEVQKPAVELLENGTTQINSSDDEEEKPKENGKATKRKNSSKQLKKEKKLKKEARMQISSKGFNESFEFSSNQESVDVDVSDGSAIESEDE